MTKLISMAIPGHKAVLRCLIAFFTCLATISTDITAAEPDPLFADNDIIKVTLSGPFRKINKERNKETIYEDARLSYTDQSGQVITLPVDLQARGNFRLDKERCRHAPLRVLFHKKSSLGTLFENQQKLKLVVSCRKQSAYKQYVIHEYFLYRMYNLLTDASFRVKLAEITYSETGRSGTHKSYGFFIEDQKRLGQRLGLKRIRGNRIEVNTLDEQQISLVALFQFLIGNTDWSVRKGEGDEDCCHNTKIMGKAGKPSIPVPYDFDFSGLIRTEYAQPQAKLRLRSVRIRRYRGFCQPDLVGMVKARASIEDVKSDLYALFENNELLTNRRKRESINYLDSYYKISNSDEKFADKIRGKCRGPRHGNNH